MGALIISAIESGLALVGSLATNINTGFTNLFVGSTSGQLTAVGTFAFVLMGLGIAVGCVKLCFNWITGRHGM